MNLEEYLKKNPKKFLIFDLDETILKLRLPWSVYTEPIKEKLLSIDLNILDKLYKKQISLSELQNEYVKKDRGMIDFFKTYNQSFESQLPGYDANPAVINFIKNDTSHTLFIWSSNCAPTVKKVLTEESILGKFRTLVTRTDVDLIKPNPEGFSHIYKEGTDLKDYLFIGDNIADKQASESVGIDFFEVNYFRLIA
ncbi:HAD-IA family hydrolase [Candidatus Woesebacteria bacterium]|nr:HAD-IA family hydrolase [Candidatus Woesebacteria bacterium]